VNGKRKQGNETLGSKGRTPKKKSPGTGGGGINRRPFAEIRWRKPQKERVLGKKVGKFRSNTGGKRGVTPLICKPSANLLVGRVRERTRNRGARRLTSNMGITIRLKRGRGPKTEDYGK